MKTKEFLNAGRLAVLALACIATITLASCSSDDEEGGNSKDTIVGTWISDTSKTPVLTYYFNRDGTGALESTGGGSATFKYTTSGGYDSPEGSIYFQFVYFYDGYVWRSESSGSYKVSGETLMLSTDGYNKDMYTRKK